MTLGESLKREGGSLISEGNCEKVRPHRFPNPQRRTLTGQGYKPPGIPPSLPHRAALPTPFLQKLQVQLRANHSWPGVGWDTETLKGHLRPAGGTLTCHYRGGQDNLGKVRRGDGQVPCAEELQGHSLPDEKLLPENETREREGPTKKGAVQVLFSPFYYYYF